MVRKSRSLALLQLRRDSRCICPLRAPASTSFPVFPDFPDFPDFAATPQFSVHPRGAAHRRLRRANKNGGRSWGPPPTRNSSLFLTCTRSALRCQGLFYLFG